MTDAEKLQLIEQIAREAFNPKWYDEPRYRVDTHRTQALANIYALFIYDGLTVSVANTERIKPTGFVSMSNTEQDDGQLSFDDLFNNGYTEEGGRNNDAE